MDHTSDEIHKQRIAFFYGLYTQLDMEEAYREGKKEGEEMVAYHTHPAIVTWAKNQIRLYKEGKLEQWKIDKLNKTEGWTWD